MRELVIALKSLVMAACAVALFGALVPTTPTRRCAGGAGRGAAGACGAASGAVRCAGTVSPVRSASGGGFVVGLTPLHSAVAAGAGAAKAKGDLTWLYIAVAAAGAGAAVFLRVSVPGRPAKLRAGAWLSLAAGLAFFLLYATGADRDALTLALGLVCTLVGAHALEAERLHERIGRLEGEVRGRGQHGG
jgi:hypothetical protein